jgi:hypothetical protein
MSGRRTCYNRGGTGCYLDPQDCVTRDVLLARTATRTLPGNDRTALEDLATPYAPRLSALKSTSEALDTQRALGAERLGQLKLGRRLGEPQVRVEGAARELGLHATHRGTQALIRTPLDAYIERCQRQTHPGHPFLISFCGLINLWK